MTDRKLAWIVGLFIFGLFCLLLVLCGVSFGADGPQEYLYRAFVRSHALSDSSLYVDGDEGDQVRCFSVSLVDTTANGVDQPYTSDVRHNWRFSMPDSAQICNCYEVAGSGADSLLWYHVRLPGKGFRQAATQLTTDAQGRWNPHVPIAADSVIVGVAQADDAVLGAGTIGTTELADSLITAAKLPASTITAVKIAAGAVGVSEIATDGVGAAEIATSAVGTAEIADGTVADGDLAGSISLSKLSTASASTNDVIAYSGSAWAKVSTLATPVNTTTVTASGTVTHNGSTVAGNDSTDVFTLDGRFKPGAFVYKTFTTSSGGSNPQTFTWTGIQPGWQFFCTCVTDPTTPRVVVGYYSSANTIALRFATGALTTVVGCLCVRPNY